jgi:hypothetical protein
MRDRNSQDIDESNTPQTIGPRLPGQRCTFAVPFQSFPEIKKLVNTLPADRYVFVIRSENEELLRIPGEAVKHAVAYLEHVSQEQAKSC